MDRCGSTGAGTRLPQPDRSRSRGWHRADAEMKVGFVGIGAMGHPMANRLREVGLLASAYDIDPARARSLGRADVAAPDLAILARASDVVITMLPSERALQDVVLGPDGLVALGLAGRTLLDMGTTSPALSRRLAEAVRSAGGSFVEAPVSGGTEAARQGTLTIIAAGDDEAYLRVRPALEVLGEKVFFVGPAGAGQTLKIANNLLFAVNVAALGEAWSLVRSAGIAAELAFNVLVACSGDSRALRTRIPAAGLVPSAPPSRDFLPGFL